MDFAKLCEQIFTLHKDIRYAGIIDDTGFLLAGGMRKGLDSMLDLPMLNERRFLCLHSIWKKIY
jgi:hypothetical protein